jgi:hypothetical protein
MFHIKPTHWTLAPLKKKTKIEDKEFNSDKKKLHCHWPPLGLNDPQYLRTSRYRISSGDMWPLFGDRTLKPFLCSV